MAKPDVEDLKKKFLEEFWANVPEPRQVTSFLRNLVGSGEEDEDVDGDNFPGFVYAQRVGKAGYDALLAHGEELNGAWREIRRGRYGIGKAMEAMATVFENYYGVFTAAAYGPDEQPRPAWLVVPFNKNDPPTTSFSTRVASVFPKSTKLVSTDFEAFGAQPARKGEDPSLYARVPFVKGSRVYIKLNNDVVDDLDNGDYVSFVFPDGVGKVPPLVIVVLRVYEGEEDEEVAVAVGGVVGPRARKRARPANAKGKRRRKAEAKA